MRASRGLKWENKMYKLKRSIAVLQGYSLKSAGGSTALGGGGERGSTIVFVSFKHPYFQFVSLPLSPCVAQAPFFRVQP